MRQRPTASKFSSAKPTGSIRLWQLAQAALARCCGQPLAHRRALPTTVLSFSAGTSGGGGGGGVPSRFSRIHLPRITGDVRVAYDVTVRMLPCRSSPPRALSSSSVDAAEAAAVDVRNAVVLREPLVEERVVGLQQVEHAAVLAQDALEEQLRLLPERLPQVVVEVREQPQVRA